MVPNYDGRRFRVAQTSATGETSSETTFRYHQRADVLWGEYEGGAIARGALVGLVRPDGRLEFHYSHVNIAGFICSGICHSVPEVGVDGRLLLHETWRWTTGDGSEGESSLEEIA